MFEHKGVILEKIKKEHLLELLELKEESWMTTHNITIANMDDQIRWYESLDKDVHCPKNLVLIGGNQEVDYGVYKISNINWISRTGMVAWDVFRRFRGNGFGKKLVEAGASFAFNVLELRRIECEILETNIASQKCAESAGFVKEGVKRQSIVRMGNSIDSWLYGCLISDFKSVDNTQAV